MRISRKGKVKRMNYEVRVFETKDDKSKVKAFATVVFGKSFKITNIAIVENSAKGEVFVSMPRYRSNEINEYGQQVYKDICNPITAEFRQELYDAILKEYECVIAHVEERDKVRFDNSPLEYSVAVTPIERQGSSLRGIARVYLEDKFVINNVSIFQGKEGVFVSMPAYKTDKQNRNGKDIYQDICFPITKDFRERLYKDIEATYEEEKEKQKNDGGRSDEKSGSKSSEDEFMKVSENPFPFR